MDNRPYAVTAKSALTVQLAYLGMSIAWNLISVALMSLGQKPLGPVGSLAMAAGLVVVAIILAVSVRRCIWLYAGTSLLLALGALATVYGAFTGEPDNWPSPFFRVLGALINIFGLISFVLACQVVSSSRKASSDLP